LSLLITDDENKTPVATPYVDEIYNTLNSHIDMPSSGYGNAIEFEDHLLGMNTQQRDVAVRNIWDQLVSFNDTQGYDSYENLRNNIDMNFLNYGADDVDVINPIKIPDRYDMFENVNPDEGYIVDTGDGYRYIKKDFSDLGGNWNNYYDAQGITTTDGNFLPILGWSDQIGVDLMINIKSWLDNEGYKESDYPKIDPRFGRQTETSPEDRKRIGMQITDKVLESGGGMDLLREVRNPNSVFFQDFDLSIDAARLLASQSEGVYSEFNKHFGPFRHAMNQTLFDISNDETMIPLIQDYKRIYDGLIADGHDKDYSQSSALKTVFKPTLKNKLKENDIVIPFWFNDSVEDAWINHALGITVPELNREALMFHNDGFKKIINTIDTYIEDGYYEPIRSESPWKNQITPTDYMDPLLYTRKMSSFINGHLNKLTKGVPPENEDDYNVQKMAIQSILMQDFMYQTRLYGDAGINPAPAAFWLIGNKDSPKFFKALKNPHLRKMLPASFKWKTDIRSIMYDRPLGDALADNFGVDRKTLNHAMRNNLVDLDADNISFTRYKRRNIVPNPNKVWNGLTTTGKFTFGAKIPVSKMFWMYQLATDGVPLGFDIIGGSLHGFGLWSDDWAPSSDIGRDFFDALGIWDGRPGERNWFSYEDGWEMAWFLEDNLFGIAGMWYDTFNRSTMDYKNIHNNGKKIFDGISTTIVDSYNRGVASKTSLEYLGGEFHDKIVHSDEYEALDNDEDKIEHYKKEWFNLAFNRETTYSKNGEPIRGAFYQDILREYVESFNGYEGGLSLINRLRVGNKAGDYYLRDIPAPEFFPPQLWDELIDVASMSDEEYIEKYPDGVGIEAFWERGGVKYKTDFINTEINKPSANKTYPNVNFLANRILHSDVKEWSKLAKIDRYSIENGLYDNFHPKDKNPNDPQYYTGDVSYGPHPYLSQEGDVTNGGKSNTFYDYNIFNSINTTFATAYKSKVLRETDSIIDDWIEMVTDTKKSIERIKRSSSFDEQYKEWQEQSLAERVKLKSIMMMPVSTRVDVEDFARTSPYLGDKPGDTLMSHFKWLEDLRESDPEAFERLMEYQMKEKLKLEKTKPDKDGFFKFKSPF